MGMFLFLGGEWSITNPWPCVSQVGNAVPPPLSKAIGLEVKKCVQETMKGNATGFFFIHQVLVDLAVRMKFNVLFNFFLRACEAGEDWGLQLKPCLHKAAVYLHCVWERFDASAH